MRRARCTTRAMSHGQIEEGRHFLEMDGKEVFRHAVARMPESVQRRARGQRATRRSDLRLLVAHQANLRIAEMMQKTLGLRDDQVYNNIMWYGNTTAATIPIALDECVRAGPDRPGRSGGTDGVRLGVLVGERRGAVGRRRRTGRRR